MTTDTAPDTLAAALARFQADMPAVHKGETADTGNYRHRYADLADVVGVVLPALAKQGLSWTVTTEYGEGQPFALRALLMHTSGDMIEASYPLPQTNNNHALGSAITYGRRYLLCAMTGVAPDDDDDGQAAARAAADAPPQQQPPRRPDAVTPEQTAQLGAALADAGMSDKDEIRAFASKVAGRELSAASDLTAAEATRVIARLREIAAEPAPAGGDES